MTALTVPTRYCGPPRSGNGGWSAGALAALVTWPVTTVRLSAPPPLDRAMSVEMEVSDDSSALVATYAGREVMRACEADHALVPVACVDLEEARGAEQTYPGLTHHPFPTCFVCGTERESGDGLRLFTGPVREGLSAATWTPSEADTATVWGALDCPGAWAADVGERLMVLGTITARVDRLPEVGAAHVVVGEARGREGRRTFTATSLYDEGATLLATAEQVWIDVEDAAVFA